MVDNSTMRETQQLQKGLGTVVGVSNYCDEFMKSLSDIRKARQVSKLQVTEMPEDDYRRFPWLEGLDWFAAHCQAMERLYKNIWTKQ